MIWYGVFLLAIGLVSALPSQKLHPFSDEFIQEINEKQSTWKAGRNFEIEDYELFKTIASGAKKSDKPLRAMKVHDENQTVPESFDAREAWSECADIIGIIRDQAECGSCWASSSAGAMSDRICIHSNGTRKNIVSDQNILTCGEAGDCTGGSPNFAWRAWESFGIVSGGLYNRTDQGCQSFFLPPCNHTNGCRNYVPDTPSCSRKCDNPKIIYESELTFGKDAIALKGEKQMQLEIMKNGPLVATFNVYEDFANYKSGVYVHIAGQLIGGHAVKILGWGKEREVHYWLAANSWNDSWGENGFFKIIRGVNEMYIEADVSAGLPDFQKF